MEGTPKQRNIPPKEDLGPKRFEIQSDDFIRERLDIIQSGIEEMQEEDPNVLGLTMFGSMVKGKAHETSDVDGYLFLDAERLAQEEEQLAAQENREARPVTFDIGDTGNLSTYPGEHLYDVYKPLIKEKFTKGDLLNEEQISDVNIRPISEEIIDRHLSSLLQASKLSENSEDGVDIEPSQNLYGLFHLSIGHGLEKYRQQVIEKLEEFGSEGEEIWSKIIGQTEKLEQYMYTDTPVRYPRTLAEARDLYIPETNSSSDIEIPPQYAGMTAEAVDIAWTIPQYVDETKTIEEHARKKNVLAQLRKTEIFDASPVEDNRELKDTSPETISETETSENEHFFEQANVKHASQKIEQLLSSSDGFNTDKVSREVYELLTKRAWFQDEKERRGTEEVDWMLREYQPQVEWYRKAVEALDTAYRQSGVETADNPAWFSVTASKRQEGKEAGAKYKVYDTIDMRDYVKVSELPKLVEKLTAIGSETGESIKIKIPRSFSGFITHNDSIVVHCDHRETCNKALTAISEWKSEQGLQSAERELGRAKIALDGKTTSNGETGSFSQIVSEHIAQWLDEHKDNYPPEVLAREAVKHAISLSQKIPNISTF
jgi:predicted nucleotidyltransferase